ncbi:CHAP domain-containing protein [Paraburkholderia aromaticivorans]|uniref:CHAP domain-containing protein n=1 Tax=Paraburkholderia aromaticivorans TaxID=2026199 RepID=UPI0014560D54|nr:CHAP domain-containing protein [Paraburkholderia aromaticivorans]
MPAYDRFGAANYVSSHAAPMSTGNCAKFVRLAIERGGIVIDRTRDAKGYGQSLISAGFYEINSAYLQKGDVVVIQPIANHPAGHMAMFDGQIWVSDSKQYHGFYPSQQYRTVQPTYKIYRHN